MARSQRTRQTGEADWTANSGDYLNLLYRFQGGRQDLVTGNINFQMRDYNPRTYTWNTQDPLGFVDGLSLYPFVTDNPINSTDPNGLLTVHIWRGRGSGENKLYGHASITLEDKTYISWWPEPTPRDPKGDIDKKGNKSIYTAPARPASYDNDERDEGHKPDNDIKMIGLDEDAIKKWWLTYSTNPENKWDTLYANCSTITEQALYQGAKTSKICAVQLDAEPPGIAESPSDAESYALRLQKDTQGRSYAYIAWRFMLGVISAY